MSVGLIVAVGVVGAFVLWETVLPWAFAVLRRWRMEQARAKEEREAGTRGNLDVAVEVRDGRGMTTTGGDPRTHEGTTGVQQQGARTGEGQRTEDGGQRQGTLDFGRTAGLADADRLWAEARDMPHNFIPDPKTDGDYLSKIYRAARLEHLEAMVKLGEYAGRRGAVVEAYYWTLLAELKGATGLKVQLRELRSRWQALGCPRQHRNAYADFTEEQGVFARAVLRLQCGVAPQYARARLKELAERGVPEAQLFLGKRLASAK